MPTSLRCGNSAPGLYAGTAVGRCKRARAALVVIVSPAHQAGLLRHTRNIEHGCVAASSGKRCGDSVSLSVTPRTFLMAAVVAEGVTTIHTKVGSRRRRRKSMLNQMGDALYEACGFADNAPHRCPAVYPTETGHRRRSAAAIKHAAAMTRGDISAAGVDLAHSQLVLHTEDAGRKRHLTD